MSEDVHTIIDTVIARMPEWLRRDLGSKDAAARERAKEALAATIAGALSGSDMGRQEGPAASRRRTLGLFNRPDSR